jgi:hypothetical protein
MKSNHHLINPPTRYSATKLLISSFLTLKQLPTYSSIRLRTLYTNQEWSYQTRRAQDIPTRLNRFMKMLSLELEDILDDDMDKGGKANVITIVGDFKIMDKAIVADVSTIVGVKDIKSNLKFKMNFSGRKGHMLACKMPSPVAPEDITQSRCILSGTCLQTCL